MIGISGLLDKFLGRGVAAVTVPVMDGRLRPNQLLEMAPVLACEDRADNLVNTGDGIVFSSGRRLLQLAVEDGRAGIVDLAHVAGDISTIASDGAEGLAIGLDSGGVVLRGGRHDGKSIDAGGQLTCPVACLFLDADTLLVANGSAQHSPSRWKHDLMSLGRTGSLWRIDLASCRSDRLATGLAYPMGMTRGPGSTVYVTEAWRHRVIAIELAAGGKSELLLDQLPGYPARLAPASGGGYWLSIFAARSQLVEFVLSEDRYRQRMMEQIEPEFWIAPDMATGRSYLEPMQGGGLKQMGIMKPWAPARSYGLVVRCDADMLPISSFHSRADGTNHGITSVIEVAGRVFASAKGPGRVVEVPVKTQNEVIDVRAA